jgi:hypothetical protein
MLSMRLCVPTYIMIQFLKQKAVSRDIVSEYLLSGYYHKLGSPAWEAEHLSLRAFGILPKSLLHTRTVQRWLFTVRLIVPSHIKARGLSMGSKVSSVCSQPNFIPHIYYILVLYYILYIMHYVLYVFDRSCLVVRVPGCRSTGPGSIPGATRLSEK